MLAFLKYLEDYHVEEGIEKVHVLLPCQFLPLDFNSDDHYIYYCGKESLRRNGVAIIVNKNPKCNTWMQSQKRQNDLCSFPRQTIPYHGNSSLCPDH